MLEKIWLGSILLKMLKLGTAKVRLVSCIIQKAKIRYTLDFNLFKMLKQGMGAVLS